jgi:ABC-type Fe3+/spermidine/putrescine transport system ATPase subunit
MGSKPYADMKTGSRNKIELDGIDATKLLVNKKGLGTVFQNYALFPHMTVFENVAFGLKAHGMKKPLVVEKVKEAPVLSDRLI